MKLRSLFIAACLVASFFAAVYGQQFPYQITDMPFNAQAVHRGIDTNCSDGGSAGAGPRREQNKAKNNFGVSGTAVVIKVTDIDRLERASVRARRCAANNGVNCKRLDLQGGLPSDRDQLKDIATSAAGDDLGEGTLVSLEAKVLDSHYSNTVYNNYGSGVHGSGESVNCGNNKVDWNDIHIVLVAPGITDECLSVTAEISPHYRPTAWRRFHKMSGAINNVARRVDFGQIQMVRITGPLFYDASHEPCSTVNGVRHRGTPARRSIWEIHPVYTLEVRVAGVWQTFEDWVTQ